MKVLYRISDTGYKKNKPPYINNLNCLKNFIKHFEISTITVIGDNLSKSTYDNITTLIPESQIITTNIGNGAGTFNLALDIAVSHNNNDEIIYFVENDYLHKNNSFNVLLEGFDLGFSYVSLYDHPDKYLDPSRGGNKYCVGGAENTKVYLSSSCHWKLTNSTTMTFASKVSTLIRNESIMRKWTSTNHPHDFNMFIEMLSNNESLATPIPGYATHGECEWLCPLTDWSSQ